MSSVDELKLVSAILESEFRDASVNCVEWAIARIYELEEAVQAERERLTRIASGNSAHGVAMELIYPGQHVTIDLSTGETRLRRVE